MFAVSVPTNFTITRGVVRNIWLGGSNPIGFNGKMFHCKILLNIFYGKIIEQWK
jgi:hypothetical protein